VRALNYVSSAIGAMAAEIRAQGLAGQTAIIVSAKHGQSPTDPTTLPGFPVARSSTASTRPGRPRVRVPAISLRSPPTTT